MKRRFGRSRRNKHDRRSLQRSGLTPDASDEEVKRAYRALAKKYHPDMNPGDAHAAEMMNKINAAYDQIKNPQPRTNTQQRQYQDDPFAGWYRQGYQQSWAQTDPMEAARRYIFVQEYERPLRELQMVPEAQRTGAVVLFCRRRQHESRQPRARLRADHARVRHGPDQRGIRRAREQIGRSGTAYHDRQTGFGFEGVDLNRTCCGLCAALQFLSCLFGGPRLPGHPVLLR